MSVRLRLTLLYTAILGVTLVAFALGVYTLLARNLVREIDDSLNAEVPQYLHGIGIDTREGVFYLRSNYMLLPTDTGHAAALPIHMQGLSGPETYAQYVSNKGTVLALSSNLALNGTRLPMPPRGLTDATFERVNANGQSVELLLQPVAVENAPNGSLAPIGTLEVARPMTEANSTLLELRLILALGVVGALSVAGLAGWVLATTALRPIVRLTRAAHEIGEAQDFSRRVAYQGPRDEIGRLAGTFNGMLSRLQAAYGRVQSSLEAQRRFVADASHELRTPLTTIRGNVELLELQEQGESAEWHEALGDIASEAERMSRLVTSLLVLARADAGQHIQRAPLSTRPVVEEVYRQARLMAGDVRLELGEVPEATVSGSADHLKQLLLILLDNAIKYSPPGGFVTISGAREPAKKGSSGPGGLRLSVADHGPGIPLEEQERIFDRFYRQDLSRHGEGAGLGLAIARWIAVEHGGELSLESAPGEGSTFTLSLPLLPDPLPPPPQPKLETAVLSAP